MRWIFVRNAVNFCKKCDKMRWIIFFHRISYINMPQKLMRWIFVWNAVNFPVNFCKKCGEIFFHRIHPNHHISYKMSTPSSHFKNSPKNLDPGNIENAGSVLKDSGWSARVALVEYLVKISHLIWDSIIFNWTVIKFIFFISHSNDKIISGNVCMKWISHRLVCIDVWKTSTLKYNV